MARSSSCAPGTYCVELLAPADSYHAVLLLGPLYHLPQRADRLRAWTEAARVTVPGGVIIAATINRYASTFDAFVKGYVADPEFLAIVAHTQKTGEHRGSVDGARYFTTAYFHQPQELAEEVADAGLRLDRIVAVEGPSWTFGRLPQIMADDAERAELLEQLRRVEAEPSLLGASSHLLAVARLPD